MDMMHCIISESWTRGIFSGVKSVYVPERDLVGTWPLQCCGKVCIKVLCWPANLHWKDWRSAYCIVFDLLSDRLRGLCYRVYVDRYYSSPKLFADLFDVQIAATGTVMPNRRDIPQQAKNTKLKHGKQVVFSKDNIQCLKWRDKRDIYMLTFLTTMTNHARYWMCGPKNWC